MKTAVEWQFEQLFNSFEKFNNGEYTFNGYLKRNLEIREQAKEMEKKEKVKEYLNGFKDGKEYQTKLDELTFKLNFKS
jgi:hypothetical protein